MKTTLIDTPTTVQVNIQGDALACRPHSFAETFNHSLGLKQCMGTFRTKPAYLTETDAVLERESGGEQYYDIKETFSPLP